MIEHREAALEGKESWLKPRPAGNGERSEMVWQFKGWGGGEDSRTMKKGQRTGRDQSSGPKRCTKTCKAPREQWVGRDRGEEINKGRP